jgi:hypothetical protein
MQLSHVIRALALSVVVLMTGCAAVGPKHAEIATSIPAVEAGKGRIMFYRPNTVLGAAITADIRLNGNVVGRSERGSFFWVDQAPCDCIVATSTEVERQLTFKLGAGETRFVKTSVSMGLMVGRINPELVNSEEWNKDLPELSYTGTPLKR